MFVFFSLVVVSVSFLTRLRFRFCSKICIHLYIQKNAHIDARLIIAHNQTGFISQLDFNHSKIWYAYLSHILAIHNNSNKLNWSSLYRFQLQRNKEKHKSHVLFDSCLVCVLFFFSSSCSALFWSFSKLDSRRRRLIVYLAKKTHDPIRITKRWI